MNEMTEESQFNGTKVIGSKLNKIKAKTLIIGFPGAGLVGSITSRTISEELELEVMGYIRSPLIPPQATYFDGILSYPYRIYADNDFDIGVVVGETPLSLEANFTIAQAIIDWAEKNKYIEEIIVVDGFTSDFTKKFDSNTYLIAEPDLLESNKFKKIKKIISLTTAGYDLISGYIGGVAGVILNESIISSIDGLALLTDCIDPNIVNVKGAANIIEILNKYLDLEVDNTALLKESEKIRSKLEEMANKRKDILQSPDKKHSRIYT